LNLIIHKSYGRENELETINKFLMEKNTDALFVKGRRRRRVWKSYLLDEGSSKRPHTKKSVSYLGSQKSLRKELYDFILKIEAKYYLLEITNHQKIKLMHSLSMIHIML
jgi:hypothetical protein